ncbi:MAG: FkbM family methyltransferase [Planctomycetota bacterium]
MRDTIKRMPLVATVQRKVVATMLNGHEFIHTVDAGPARGLVFPIHMPEDKNVWTGTYENHFVSELVADVSDTSICFDIGGWRGYCGGALAATGAAQVVIFEPLPANCDRIQRLIELNPKLPIHLVQAAVGATDGRATLALMSQTSMGKLESSTFQETAHQQDRIEVDLVSLDRWCEAHDLYPSIMKVDVEGAEVMVLQGAREVLAKSQPRLLVEAHSRDLAQQVAVLLEEIGYECHALETGQRPDGETGPDVSHLVCHVPETAPAA